MTSPDEYGEEFRNTDANDIVDRIIADYFEPEMRGTEAADLATKLVVVPVRPDGGRIGRILGSRIRATGGVRDLLRVWSPGLTASVLFALWALAFPVTVPLMVYGVALVGFAWWHAAGRPRLPIVLRIVVHIVGVVLRFSAQVVLFLAGHARAAAGLIVCGSIGRHFSRQVPSTRRRSTN